MTQDLTQWIAEVRTLQRQLAETRRDRDQAYNSAANWRRLYDNEARQRRQEAEQFQAYLEALSQTSQTQPGTAPEIPGALGNLEVASSSELAQDQLQVLIHRCQELTRQLEAEKQAHAQTRQTLTTALGETFDRLKAPKDTQVLLQ